ncbi:MAG: exo-alpha-sialidase [Lachnospiraceae bacterium]|nr:exo-alpha-sialidase [Lachnospiraceae bacterium]
MNNAREYMCEMLVNPTDAKYAENIRKFQGCPTIAITRNGRIYMGWYSGGTREPHIENYNLVVYSDDFGVSWSNPVLIIPSNKERLVQALDIQLWLSPEGKLFVFWVQDNAEIQNGITDKFVVDGYSFGDTEHAQWLCVCEDPDAVTPMFSQGRCIGGGFLRCKPLVMSNGEWLLWNYDQLNDRYGYSISSDRGQTFVRHYGAKKIEVEHDECMAYEKLDGSIRMLARCKKGELAESTSNDYAKSWSETKLSGIITPDTRIYVSRTPSGRILLVNNDHASVRCNMTIYLSEDDGATWKYKRCIDERTRISYPDVDFYGGRIYLVYDRERSGEGAAREILFTSFTEEDIMDEQYEFKLTIVSKSDY